MLPEYTRREAVRLIVVLAIVIASFLFFLREPRPPLASAARTPASTKAVATRDETELIPPPNANLPVPPRVIEKEAPRRFPPLTDHSLMVWDYEGKLTEEVIDRYKLTGQQQSQLKELKVECDRRKQAIDQANASIATTPDNLSVLITIKPDPTAAKAFTDFYQDRLQQILGAEIYADLANYYDTPYLEETMNAGLLDKQITVQKILSEGSEVQYHIKAESKQRASPLNLPPAYASHSIETTATREKISIAYSGIEKLLPPDF